MMNNLIFNLISLARTGGNPMTLIQQMAGRDPRAATGAKDGSGQDARPAPADGGEHGERTRNDRGGNRQKSWALNKHSPISSGS